MASSEAGDPTSSQGVAGHRVRIGASRLRAGARHPFVWIGVRLQLTPLWTLLLVGLAVRLLLAPFTSWTHDVYPVYRVAVDTLGGLDPYATSFYTYPPLLAYLLFPPNLLLGLLTDPASFATLVPSLALAAETTEMITPTVTSPFFNLAYRIPLIAADVGIALLLLSWVSGSFGEKRGRSAFLLWFFNPLVIWVTVLQGQFDVIPAFLTLAASFLLLRRSYLFAGLALGLATLFKFYPLFLVIPLLFLAVALEQSRSKEETRPKLALARAPALFLLGNGVILAALALPLLSTPFLELSLIRRSQFLALGGFHPLFFLALDIWERLGFGQILLFLPASAYAFLVVVPVGVSLLAGFFVVRRTGLMVGPGRGEGAIVFLTVIPLVVLYSALPQVNPQHLLWVLPFLILAIALWRSLLVPTVVISLAGLAFLLGLQGVAVFFYPLAVFTPLLGVEGIQDQVVAYWNLPGLVSTRLQMDLLALASGIGYLTLVLAAYRIAKRFLASSPTARVPASVPTNPGPPPRAERPLRWTITSMAVFLVVSQGFVLIQDVPTAARVERVAFDADLGIVTVDLRGHGLFPASYRAAALALGEVPKRLPVHLYYDGAYPTSNTSAARIIGLRDHLGSELARGGVPTEIHLLNAASLASLLRGPPAILVMGSTAWPATILPNQPTLVRQWLEGGGILIWSGALLGAYGGREGGKTLDLRTEYPTRPWGPSVILGFDPVGVGGPNRTSNVSPWGVALDIRFPLAAWGARMSEIDGHGGLALGSLTPEADPKASLSLFPVGNGTVALFGDAMGPVFTYSAEDVVAHDIVRLLLSGLLFNPSPGAATLLGSQLVDLGPGQRGRVSLPMEVPGAALHVRVLVFSDVDHDPLLRALTVPV